MPTFEKIAATLGQLIQSEEVVELFASCSEAPIISYDSMFTRCYSFMTEGFELKCDKDPERVSGISFYDSGKFGSGGMHSSFASYPSVFPSKVRFGDTPDDVQNKLGKPVASGEDQVLIDKDTKQRIVWLRYSYGEKLRRFCFAAHNKKLFRVDIQRDVGEQMRAMLRGEQSC